MKTFVRRFFAEEDGQALTEYGLLVAAVVVLTIVVSLAFRDDVATLFQTIGEYITGG